MWLKNAKFNETADRLNDLLSYFITADFRKVDFKNQEKLLLADDRFQEAVQTARERLDIANTTHSMNAEDDRVADEAILVLEKTNMPNGWFGYTCEYIVNDGIVNTRAEATLHIEVDDAKDDEIVVTLKRGLTSKEYKTAWKALKVFFEEDPTHFATTEEDEKQKVYFASKRGLTPSVIAKQYFPNEYARDPFATRDRIKKIIKRYSSKK